ncbi:MAG: helix-turn-helix domain-containing protein [Deltaproteobacteria bacterium]|nr:helix-turn-helix domain-containing protein [Deltaproteobacteria bacterium]
MSLERVEMLQRIGSRIRAERNRLGLTLEALAAKVGVSKMTLQRIETGATSPSIVTLTDISFHLKQPIESLIREGEPNVVLLKKDSQDTLFDPESGIRVLAPRGLVSERVTITCARLDLDTVIETHVNRGFEWAYLVQGKAVVTVGSKEYPVEKGDAIFYDAHYPHSIHVLETVQYVGLFLHDE